MSRVTEIPRQSEAQFQAAVIEFATYAGWRVAHMRPVETAKGRWITAFQGHKGFPDLVLAKDGRSLLVELKRVGEHPTADQQAWLTAAGGFCWTPADWDDICVALTRRPA